MDLPRIALPRFAKLALELALIAAVFVAVTRYQTRKHLSGVPAPQFSLLDLAGRPVSLSAYRHKKVLLHFWATWCGVCRAELPSVKSVHANLDADEVLLTIVEDADDLDALRAFAHEHELRYPILLGTREVLGAYRVSSFPTNYYLDGRGTVRATTVGLSTRLGMAARLFVTSSD